MELGDDNVESFWPGNALERLITRSSCSITELTLARMHIPADALISFLRSMPQLLSFVIWELNDGEYGVIGPDVIHALSLTENGQPVLLPKMTTFEVANSYQPSATQLAGMVESRGWSREDAGSNLESPRLMRVRGYFFLGLHTVADERGIARLRLCRATGLDISCQWVKRHSLGIDIVTL